MKNHNYINTNTHNEIPPKFLSFIGSESSGTTLTITGTGFSTTNNTVTIGNTDCDITSATDTELQCDIGQGPAGSHRVIVNVGDKGLALHDGGPFNITYEFSITGINPTSGSLAGQNTHTCVTISIQF